VDRHQAHQDRIQQNRRVRAGRRRVLQEHLAQNTTRWLRGHRIRSEILGDELRGYLELAVFRLVHGSFWSFTSRWEVFAGDVKVDCAVVNIVTINNCVIYLFIYLFIMH